MAENRKPPLHMMWRRFFVAFATTGCGIKPFNCLSLYKTRKETMKRRFLLVAMAAIVGVFAAISQERTYTVIVSLDGFRYDYAEAYSTPTFDAMAAQGVKARMMPSYPSKTFPNHYTLATGLVPDHHGIVANSFYAGERYFSLGDSASRSDGSFYLGEPIWNTVRKAGKRSATIYWVSSDVAVQGQHPDVWVDYLKKPLLTYDQRVKMALDLLQKPENERPDLLMMYFEEPDVVGHNMFPLSKQTKKVVESLDSLMGVLWAGIKALPIADKVNFIVTSDHGMETVSPDRIVPVVKHLKKEWVRRIDGNLPAQIYVSKPEYVDSVLFALKDVDHARVCRRQDVPKYLNYGTSDRVGDVLVMPDLGWLAQDNDVFAPGGAHGFDHTAQAMHVMFRAVGPAFKTGYVKQGVFQNTNIYSLLARLLGIEQWAAPTDGDIKNVEDMLK